MPVDTSETKEFRLVEISLQASKFLAANVNITISLLALSQSTPRKSCMNVHQGIWGACSITLIAHAHAIANAIPRVIACAS